jgi:steroid 5-alpha reductase family enzyme
VNLAWPMLLGWGVLAVIWLAAMPSDTRGKSWHYVHVLIPFAVIIVFSTLPDSSLREVLKVWLAAGAVILIGLVVTWAVGTARQNHGIMDVAYTLLVLCAAGFMAYRFRTNFSWWSALLLAMTAAWAIRLSIQTFGQNIAREREPYATWRRRGGTRWIWWSFFQIHALQGVLIWIWSLPFAFAFGAHSPQPLLLAAVGFVVWLIGFLFQTIADVQLKRFKDDAANRGKLLTTGAWSVTRQPNYFGEAVMWWGYFVFALAHPFGLLALVSPAYVTWFMGYGSAGRFKEMHMSRTRPEAWASYVATTPRFFPWPRPVRH